MKCPECIKEGKKSTVTVGAQWINATYHPVMYDEDGKLMDTGHAGSTQHYSCSNGHKWKVTS